MMDRLFSRIRVSTAIAAVLALIVTGIATGAAGGYLILGQANDSGTSQTVLFNAGLGAAFTLKTTNIATGATGIFGYSNSTQTYATKGVYGRVDGPNSYGVYGQNTGPAGSGAAVYADGGNNTGVVVNVASNSIPPIKVNSTGLVSNLNSDLLDGYNANALTRFAYAAKDNNSLVGTSGTVISTTITAPVRGWFEIVASSDVYGSATDVFSCQLQVDTNLIASSVRTSELTSPSYEQNCNTDGAYFTCGGASTVSFQAAGVAATTIFDESTIEVTFHPFNGAGNAPSILPCIVVLKPSAGFSQTNP